MFQKKLQIELLLNTKYKNYGRLSIISNWKLNIKKIFDIKAKVFFQNQKLKVQHFFFTLKKNFHKLKNPKNLELITRIFFNHRRKMIKKPYNQIFNGKLEIF